MQLETAEALILAIGALGLGLVLLIKGGSWTIDAAIFLARRMGVSPMIVGFTIVAFGTSLPELLVSINANISGSPGIAIGNVLGSNIANILLVIGATAVFAVIHAVPRALMRDLAMMMLTTAGFAVLLINGAITWIAGMAMVTILVLYSAWQYFMALRGEIPIDEVEEPEFSSLRNALLFLTAGLICIALGAEFLVRGAKVSATIIGVPEAVIGLSVIAIGTSLPELSTCIAAAAKRQADIILGNIIGSNVFNILMIIGVTASIKSVDVTITAPQLVSFDIWVTLGVSTLFTLVLLFYRKINRFLGVSFLALYAGYIIYIYANYLKGSL